MVAKFIGEQKLEEKLTTCNGSQRQIQDTFVLSQSPTLNGSKCFSLGNAPISYQRRSFLSTSSEFSDKDCFDVDGKLTDESYHNIEEIYIEDDEPQMMTLNESVLEENEQLRSRLAILERSYIKMCNTIVWPGLDDDSLCVQKTSNLPECYELSQRNENDRVTDICAEHTLPDQSEIDNSVNDCSGSDSKNEQKPKEKSITREEWLEIDESFDDGYELIKKEYLSQISCNDRLEILRKQGYSESEIDEICSKGGSWYTQMTIPILENKAPPSLMYSRDSLRKQVCIWFVQECGLTESQEKLNKELLSILKYLDWYDEDALFDYDNGSVRMLEEFLENNRNNPDLKIVLNLERGESRTTVLHAVSGACICESGRDHEHRAVSLLLVAGADPNAKDNEGETPLHYATAIGNDEGVSSLLWGGANPNICNKQGKTPQQIAINGGHYNVVELLLTEKQKKLGKELYGMFDVPLNKNLHMDPSYSRYCNNFTRNLKEFLNKHKNDPDLKVVLSIGKGDKLKAVELVEYIYWHNQTVGVEAMNLLFDAGLPYYGANPCTQRRYSSTLWNHLTSNQQVELNEFFNKVSKVQNIKQLEEIVSKAIQSRVQLNFSKDVSPNDPLLFDSYSFTDYVMKRIGELNELERNPKVASDIVCKLVSRGAVLCNRKSMDVIDKLELEFKAHKANIVRAYADYINSAHKFIEIARSATSGKLCDVKIDHVASYLEYSEDSTIDVAKITEGKRNLGLTQGNGRNVIKIGKSEVEIITANGIRNYTDFADNSDIVLTFYTSLGELEVRLYPDKQSKDLIKVEVKDQEKWKKLKNCEEKIGKNCLLGGLSVNEAIEQGYFFRSGKLCQPSETLSVNSSLGDVSLSSPIQESVQKGR